MTFHDLSLTELRDLTESTVTVAAAAEAGVFEALADGAASAPDLARRLGLDGRAVAILLPVLVELRLLEAAGDGEAAGGDAAGGEAADGEPRYRLSERGRRELGDRRSPDFVGAGLPLWLENLRAWTELPATLRDGRPVHRAGEGDGGEDEETRRSHIARFMAGMAAAPGERVDRLVDAVLARRPGARSLLDVGGGPGHIARAFVDRGLEAVVLDRPEVVDYVRGAFGLDEADGLSTVGADFLEHPLPDGPFDVVLLSNILHMLSPEQNVTLLHQARDVVAPGGVVAIADFVRGRSPRAARFALVMLLRTDGGNTYTLADHEAWLDAAGFHHVELTDLDPERQLITALAPGRPPPGPTPRTPRPG